MTREPRMPRVQVCHVKQRNEGLKKTTQTKDNGRIRNENHLFSHDKMKCKTEILTHDNIVQCT